MEKNNANEQAFPYYDSTGSISGIGLTKREYFAGLAMQGILARINIPPDEIAKRAIKYADWLLHQLNQTQ